MKKLISFLILLVICNYPKNIQARHNASVRTREERKINSYQTKNGIHWLGIQRGILQYNALTDSIHFILEADSIKLEKVSDIAVTDSNSVWFAANDSLLINYNGEIWSNHKLPRFLSGKIQNLMADANGELWIATDSKIVMLNTKNKQEVYLNPLKYSITDMILLDDMIWIRSWKEIAVFAEGSWKVHTLDYSHYEPNLMLTINIDSEKNIFAQFHNKIFAVSLEENELIVLEDKKFKRCTFQGLFITKNNEFLSFKGSKDNPKNGFIFQLNFDKPKTELQKISKFRSRGDKTYVAQVKENHRNEIFLTTHDTFLKLEGGETKSIKLFRSPLDLELNNKGVYRDLYNEYRILYASSKGKFIDKQEEGYWKYFFNPGLIDRMIFKEGNFINGLREGIWKTYQTHGNNISKINYHNGYKDGEAMTFEPPFEKGFGVFKDGLKVGVWKHVDYTGSVRAIYNYKNGKEHGKSIKYFSTGISQVAIFDQGVIVEDWELCRADGEKIYSNKYPEIIKSKTLEKDEPKNGIRTTLIDKNYQLTKEFDKAKYYRVAEYKDDKPIGIARDYYLNGNLKFEGTLLSEFPSLYDCLKSDYHFSGKLIQQGELVKGVKHGTWIEYIFQDNKRTELYWEGNYNKGKREDLWKLYENEQQIDLAFYENGKTTPPLNLSQKTPNTYLNYLDFYDNKPLIVSSINPEAWNLEHYLPMLMKKIKSKKQFSITVRKDCSQWPEGKISTEGREAMYLIEGFIQGKYPPTESSITDFDPDPKYYKKWWKKYRRSLKNTK